MLTNTKLANLKPRNVPYKVTDMNGLVVVVYTNGRRYWRLRYKFAEREKTLSLGRYPSVSLAEARLKCEETRKLIRDGVDPSFSRQKAKREIVIAHDNTFKSVATEWYEIYKARCTARHAKKTWEMLELHIFPGLAKYPITEIKPRDLLGELRRIEAAGTIETTHRALDACGQIFRYGIATDVCERNPASEIRSGLKPRCPEGYPVIEIEEIPKFLRKLDAHDGRAIDKLALRLLLLTVLRTGELRRCKWEYVNIPLAQIRVPAEIMKMPRLQKRISQPHIVPLSAQAIQTLKILWEISGHQEWLLPNPCSAKNPYISENVVNNLIADLGYGGKMTGHSVRKLFSTVLNEQEFNPDAIERQLGHGERRKERAAYNHARYLKTRHFLMKWWADYLDFQAGVQVVDTGANIALPPAGSAGAQFYLPGIDPHLDSTIPRAFANPNHVQNFGQF